MSEPIALPTGPGPLRREQARVLALAGLVQAAATVHALAHGRSIEDRKVNPLVRTIFVTNPDSLEAIFPNTAPYRDGIALANDILSAPANAPQDAMKYSVVLIDIEKQLRARPSVIERLGTGITAIEEPVWSEPLPQALYDQLSAVYQDTVSTLSRRVQVTGDPQQLRNETVAARVRTLLLAGVRLAWLWHQLGGRRWHLVMRRSKIRQVLAQLDRGAAATPLH